MKTIIKNLVEFLVGTNNRDERFSSLAAKPTKASRWIESRNFRPPGNSTQFPPLPEGEGRGEGEGANLVHWRLILGHHGHRAATLLLLLIFHLSPARASNYTAHEWGTFTSVQGNNGELLSWRPLQSSELPNFVFSTTGSSLVPGPFNFSKVAMITLQRMETPVIYFYADQPMNVDVNVAFPKGYLTEWYPQATEIGPVIALNNTNTPATTILHESRAIWRNLEILPQTKAQASLADALPQEKSGSHYFAARETQSSYVRANFANAPSELEKFIFYRGAGSFKTPLRVTADSNSVVTVENTGAQPLAHLFLLNIRDGFGSFGVLDELASSNSVTWLPLNDDTAGHWRHFALPQFQNEIATQIQTALIAEGLFPDEAKAMVNTWKDSWFTEEGVRVLYLLPRPWTDEILPLTLTPSPTNLTRVMVGRAEVITDQAATTLLQMLSSAQNGDSTSRDQVIDAFKKLGRFAGPALQLALTHNSDPGLATFSYQLLYPPATHCASQLNGCHFKSRSIAVRPWPP